MPSQINPVKNGPVKIAKETASSWTTKNPHARDNVNVAMGPRTGNAGAHDGKRGAFISAKEERAPLADYITRAYEDRGQDTADTIRKG